MTSQETKNPSPAVEARLRAEFMAVASEILGAPLWDPSKRRSEQVVAERPYDLVSGDPDFATFSLDGFDPTENGGFLARYSNAPQGQRQGFPNLSYPERHLVLEFIADVLERRSRRMAEDGSVTPIPKDWFSPLRQQYPQWIDHGHAEHGPGWADLIAVMLDRIDALPDDDKQGLRFDQIKEKFGGLRVYHTGGDAVEEITNTAEALSEALCDQCSAPGHPRSGGWISTRCDEHA